MTSQQAQLQALITEIEALLGKAVPRLPWTMPGEASEQRRVMSQALDYLKELQTTGTLAPSWGSVADMEAAPPLDLSDADDTAEVNSQRVLKALLQEMQYLRAQMVQPLTQEVMSLQQQREVLKNEVRQLEQARLQMAEAAASPQLNPAWVNAVVEQLRSSLLEQLTPQLKAWQAAIADPPALYGTAIDPLEAAADLPQLSPQQRLEQLRQLQAQTDDMLLRLDSNLRAVFESLDQSIQTYCDTLSQGLDDMHGLGQQGEFIFRTFINRLAQQLQQESELLSSGELGFAQLRGQAAGELGDRAFRADGADETFLSEGESQDAVVELDEVDLGEFELDAETDEEEVTLFQLDEEFADLDLAEEEPEEDEDKTLLQTKPVTTESLEADDSETEGSEPENDAASAYTEEIDSLYASLFGETDKTFTPASAPAPAAESTIETTLDEYLLNADAPPEPATAKVRETAPEGTISAFPEAASETSLESLLEARDLAADDTASAPTDAASWETLLGPEIANELRPTESASEAFDTISSLTELLPETDTDRTDRVNDPFATFDDAEDAFIPAPPDENLLEAEAEAAASTLDLSLDDATLGQLSTDLSKLEGLPSETLELSPLPTLDDTAASAPSVEIPDEQEAELPAQAEEPQATANPDILGVANAHLERADGAEPDLELSASVEAEEKSDAGAEPRTAVEITTVPEVNPDAEAMSSPTEESAAVNDADSFAAETSIDAALTDDTEFVAEPIADTDAELTPETLFESAPDDSTPPEELAAPESAAMTAATFDMPVEPLSEPADVDTVDTDDFELSIEPLAETVQDSSEEAFSLTLEGISLDLELPDLPEEAFSWRQGASDVDRAIADSEAITLEDELFPETEATTPTEPPSDTVADWQAGAPLPSDSLSSETLANWSESLDEAASSSAPEAEDGVLADDLAPALDSDRFSEPPPSAGSSLDDLAVDWGDEGSDSEDDSAFSLGNLDLNLSLEVAESTAASEPESEDFFAEWDTDREPTAPASTSEETTADTALELTGAADEGVEIAADTEDADNLFAELADTLPDASEAIAEERDSPLSIADDLTDLGADLSSEEIDVTGSPEAGFDLTVEASNEALEATLETLPDYEAAESVPMTDEPAAAPSQQPELGRQSEAEQTELVSADSLPFSSEEPPFPNVPDYAADEPVSFETEEEEVAIAAASEAPELDLEGTVETGFEVAEADETALVAAMDELPTVADDISTETEPPAPSAFAEESANESPAGPLSDDELADLFPPQLMVDEAAADQEDEWGLDTLFDEPSSFDEAFTSPQPTVDDGDIETVEATAETPEAIAASDDESPLPEPDLLSDPDFAELFPPSEEPAVVDEPLPATELVQPNEELPPAIDLNETDWADTALSESDYETAEVTAAADFDEVAESTVPELEDWLIDEPTSDSLSAPADWDPMQADQVEAEQNDTAIEDFEDPDLTETESAEPELFENLDLSMEEIPETEIENDDVFRSAFDEDFFAESEKVTESPELLTELGDESLTEDVVLNRTLAPETETFPEPAARTADSEAATAAPIADDEENPELFASSGMLATIASNDTDAEEPDDFTAETTAPEAEWFLGIDLGASGLSAVLMNRLVGSVHPLCWVPIADPGKQQTTFRVPTVAAFRPAESAAPTQLALEAVGLAALPREPEDAQKPLLHNLRSLLRVGVPHQTTAGTQEPRIQWSEAQTISLQQVMDSVQALLTLILGADDEAFDTEAVGLDALALSDALDSLQGIIVGLPSSWSDTYCLNIREAILAAGLIDEPGQVFFLEEAIAAVLSGLPDPHEPPPEENRQMQTLYQCAWQGGTVVISGGAAHTEVGIVDLPYPLDTLSREDFKLRDLPYGGDALDLDIICQLLVPTERRQPINPNNDRRRSRDGWSWQATLPEVADARWEELQLEAMDLPQLAESDSSARIRLRQHLEALPLGQSLLEAARYLKLILQNQNQYQLELADQSWRVLRRDLESRVLIPYIQRLNQQVNALLSQTGLSSQGINQVICTGGNASFNTIAKWLRQKFPNATIIQDTYPSNRPQTCSRVAYGLVNLCRYPQILDVPRHQYSDYFLLHEIIRIAPETPMPFNGILHLLEEQGINTDACQSRIEAILEGHLPPGLVPDAATRAYLSQATLDSDAYQALTAGSLFTKQTRQIYMLNTQQRDRLQNHLAALMLNKHQMLTEPLIAQLVAV